MVPDGGRWCIPHRSDNRELRAQRDRSALRRSSGLKSLYDSAAWRSRTRAFILSRDPLCQIPVLCEGRALSVDVDHIIRAELYIQMHGGNTTFFFDTENLRGVCHIDHTRKTALENSGLWSEDQAAAIIDL